MSHTDGPATSEDGPLRAPPWLPQITLLMTRMSSKMLEMADLMKAQGEVLHELAATLDARRNHQHPGGEQ